MKNLFLTIGIAVTVAGNNLALASPTVKLETDVVRIPAIADGTDHPAHLVIILEGLAPNALAIDSAPSTPEDVISAAPTPPIVKFLPPMSLSDKPMQHRWLLPLTITRMPSNVDLTRIAKFKVGTRELTFPYKLSTRPTPSASWSLKPTPLSARAISPGGTVALSISVTGGLPVSKLRLISTDFIDPSTKETLASGKLTLCENPAPCQPNDEITLGSPGGPLWLAPRLDSAKGKAPEMSAGKYEGQVTIASDDKPAGESANITIYVTSSFWKSIGFCLILVGVIAAWYVTTFLRRRLIREQMLLLAVYLRAALDVLARKIALAPVNLPSISKRFEEIDLALSDEQLELHGLPSIVPQVSPSVPEPDDIASYKTHVLQQQVWVTVLATIVSEGINRLVARRDKHLAENSGQLTAAQSLAFNEAIDALDQIANLSTAPIESELRTQLAEQLRKFEVTLGPLNLAARDTLVIKETRSPERLRSRIALGNMVAWGFIGTVTSLAGLHVLILTNPGFGTPIELLGCFLWGAGIPASTLLASTTTESIVTKFSVTR